jgi:hypothetical protein
VAHEDGTSTLDNGLRNAGPDYFIDALFFSIQTMTTIGSAMITVHRDPVRSQRS